MIFGLHPIIGFLPLLIYIIITFKGHGVIKSVFIAIIIGAILTGQTPVSIGEAIAQGLGSFLGLIGFIILVGAGLGELLERSKVAQNIVHIILNKTGVKTQKQAMLATIISMLILTMFLGSFTGPAAILAPIIIPIFALLKLSPSTLGVIYHGAGAAGLFVGPFVPPVVTVMGLTGLSYGAYMLNVGFPIGAITLVVTYFVALNVQKTNKEYQYTKEDMLETENFEPTPKIVNATLTFIVSMVLLLVYGVFVQAGASYVIFVMLLCSFLTGYVAGFNTEEIIDSIIKGSSKQFWLFFLFVLYEPFLNFIVQSGAYDAMAELIEPMIEAGGQAVFMIFASLFGIFGVSGAAVAQKVVLNDLFQPLVQGFNFPMHLWAIVLLVGAQITFFAYPTGDMVGQMGLARSKDLKGMLKNGWAIVIASIIFVSLRALLFPF